MLAISQIWIYPVKSFAGVRVPRARVDDRGLEGDRRFMVVDESGAFLTQRGHPRMARVRARIEGGALRLEHERMTPLSVPLDVEGPARDVHVWGDRVLAVDAGDDAAAWIGEAIGAPARLVRMPASTRRAADPEHARPGDLVAFADGFPFLLVTEGSLDALSAELGGPADVRRFRPNLVVRGAAPFAEDGWRELAVAGVRFLVRKPCGRCRVVDVDPDRGEPGGGVLAALARSRTVGHAVLFGQNLVHDGEGELAEGDPVRVLA